MALPATLRRLLIAAVLLGAAIVASAEGPAQCAIATRSQTVGSGTIVYNIVGNGPNVLLIHGLFADKDQWMALACRLAGAGYTALAPDLPGYGKSTGYAVADYRLETQVALLHALAAHLGIDRVHIAGNSMGGTIAAMYADRYPSQVRSLAFLGSPLGVIAFNDGVADAIFQGINPFIPIDAAQLDLELSLLFVTPPTLAPATRQAIVANYVADRQHFVQVWNIVNLYIDALRSVPPPRAPALIVWGKDDRIFSVAGADQLHRRIPRSVVYRLPHAGHLLHLENAAEVAPIYVRFLRGAK